jgi:hypothetical protein
MNQPPPQGWGQPPGPYGPPPGSGYGPPPQGYPPQPPPKKGMSGAMIALLVLGGIVVLGFGSCVVCVGLAGNAARKNVEAAEKRDPSRTSTTPPGTPTAPAETATPVPITKLLAEYKDNEVRADQEFKGRVVRVTGQVHSIKKSLTGMYLTVGTGKPIEIPQVQCDLNDENKSAAASLSKGQTVTVEGRVSGLMMNVFLKDCDVVQ